MNEIVGINSESLKKLIFEIYDYRDKISNILNTAEILIKNSENYYISSDGDELRKHFNNFSSNFNIFFKNIKSYSDDLELVLITYQNFLKSSNKI